MAQPTARCRTGGEAGFIAAAGIRWRHLAELAANASAGGPGPVYRHLCQCEGSISDMEKKT